MRGVAAYADVCIPALQKYEFIRYALVCSLLFPYFCPIKSLSRHRDLKNRNA